MRQMTLTRAAELAAHDERVRGRFSLIDVADLDPAECRALLADLREIAAEPGQPGDIETAEREMLARLGGQQAVRGYVDCLMVQEAHRGL